MDLRELPVPNGSANFDAITTEGIPVGFRFDNGWLAVRISERGGTENYFEMNNVIFERTVAQTWTHDTYPDQICAFLGITVNGQKIEHPKTIPHWTAADLSGNMTYWQSGHKTKIGDMAKFIDRVLEKNPDCFLYQRTHSYDAGKPRLRKVDILFEDDRGITIAFGCNQTDFDNYIEKRDDSSIPFKIEIFKKVSSDKAATYRDLILKDYKGTQNFKVMACPHYTINAAFKSNDEFAKARMKSFLTLLNEYFVRGLKAFNLETREYVMDVPDPMDYNGYSVALRDWCLEQDSNYLEIAHRKIPDYGTPTFLGYRPI